MEKKLLLNLFSQPLLLGEILDFVYFLVGVGSGCASRGGAGCERRHTKGAGNSKLHKSCAQILIPTACFFLPSPCNGCF
jgi:hypothetical protein